MRSDLLDRVRKLLALAGSSNVHEAAAAAARAQALVRAHQLEDWLAAEAELDADPITDGRDAPLEVARKIRTWKLALAGALADANGLVAWVWDRGDGKAVCLAGRARDREAALALWEALVRRIEWLSATAGPGRSRAWHEAFRIGAADAIADRLAAVDEIARADLPSTSLARVDARSEAHRRALERWVAKHLGQGAGRAVRVNARAWEAGRAAGTALPLPERPKG